MVQNMKTKRKRRVRAMIAAELVVLLGLLAVIFAARGKQDPLFDSLESMASDYIEYGPGGWRVEEGQVSLNGNPEINLLKYLF
jgi:hypothetical protein